MEKSLNIITLNIPYPPDYGGIIDSYYRIKGLSELGIKIHLHTFLYNRTPSAELEKYCEKIYYYKRDTSFIQQFSCTPFIVKSRSNKTLLGNLLENDYPILFDGLHVAYYLKHPLLKKRNKIVRAHNIEHDYYNNLAKNEINIIKKMYFGLEALRLKRFEKILSNADAVAAVSTLDHKYFMEQYGNSTFIPSSHKYDEVVCKEGKGQFILYHGDLSVNENEKIVSFIINNIMPYVNFPFIIAGKNPSGRLLANAKKQQHLQIIANPDSTEMEELIQNAHIHLLPVLRTCGLKLKLLYALYAGRFCVVNEEMVSGTNLGAICEIAGSNESFIEQLNQLIQEPFTKLVIERRKEYINQYYSPARNAQQFVDLLNRNQK